MGVAVAALLLAVILCAGVTAVIETRLLRGELGPARAAALHGAPRLPNADRWLYPAGAIVALAGVALAAVVVPLGPALIGQDLLTGVFYFIVVLDFVVLGIALTGWGANTPNSVESCYRAVAQLVSYVIPLGLALVGVIMMSKSLSSTRIVAAQSDLWFVVLQPIGFVLYLVSGVMQAYRRPFLEPFASAIDGGILGAVGGAPALLWRIALSGLFFLVAAMGAVLFLGGWTGPWLPGPVWMIVKTLALMALMLILARRIPPLSAAHMLALSWKVLTPVGLLNVLAVGVLILVHIGPA
jgi:NADH-quinone oxidoreductase subunit H